MLYEIKEVNQDTLAYQKRWFFDHEIDLLLWLDKNNEIAGFQLCYDKPDNPHALTWFKDKGYRLNRIDFREDKIGRRRGSPILLADGKFERDRIAKEFLRLSRDLDSWVSTFVYEKIQDFLLAE
jgi:hypothetical protein